MAASVVLLYSGLLTSLAGSLFAIKLHEFHTTDTNTTATGTLGFNDDAIENVATYAGAAGVSQCCSYSILYRVRHLKLRHRPHSTRALAVSFTRATVLPKPVFLDT